MSLVSRSDDDADRARVMARRRELQLKNVIARDFMFVGSMDASLSFFAASVMMVMIEMT